MKAQGKRAWQIRYVQKNSQTHASFRADLLYLRWMALAAAGFNALLILPDSINVENPTLTFWIGGLRLAYSLALIALACWAPRIREGTAYYQIVVLYELLAIALFLFVYVAYDQPNFLIQSMGLMMLLIIFFFVPNDLADTIILACTAIFLFLAVTLSKSLEVSVRELAAGMVYLGLTTLLCSLFAHYRNRHAIRAKKAHQELLKVSETDDLTGIANRQKFLREYERWVAWSQREQKTLFFSFFDIDRFKQINDQLGHLKADEILIKLTEVIASELRPNDVFARWGGDEFILLFPQTNLDEGEQILYRLQQCILHQKFGQNIDFSCSFGAIAFQGERALDEVLHHADERMYLCKKEGGNRISVAAF